MLRFHTRRLALASLFVVSLPVLAQTRIETVVTGLDSAPGMSPEAYFSNSASAFFGMPVINQAGEVSFAARVRETGVPYVDTGIWTNAGGELSLVAGEGDVTPGSSQEFFFDFFHASSLFEPQHWLYLTDAGETVFRAQATDKVRIPPFSAASSGIWSYSAGVLSRIAREETLVPGLIDTSFANFGSMPLQFGTSGETVFATDMYRQSPSGLQGTVIWSWHEGTLTSLVQEGDAAPGVPGGLLGNVSGLPRFGAGNHLGFLTSLSGVGIDATNDGALFAGVPGSLRLVAREGEVAEGTNGAMFQSLATYFPVGGSDIGLSNDGRVAFAATLTGAGVDNSNDRGVWRESNGSRSLLVREGGAIPGGVLRSLNGVLFGDGGHIVIQGPVSPDGQPETLVHTTWLTDHNDELHRIAQWGQDAPGRDGAVMLDPIPIAVNGTGQVLLYSELLVPDEGGLADSYWIVDTDSPARLLIQSGELIDVDSDPLVEDLRIVSRIEYDEYNVANSQFFNDRGQFTFRAFISTLDQTVVLPTILVVSPEDLDPGDVTGDGLVGIEDLDILLANWGDAVGVRAQSSGDLSGDGVVGQQDLDLLIAHWGEGEIPDINIPEPGALAIMGLGTLALMRRRCGRFGQVR
ncbi:PEP-CTERM sorting domain-containing protein [Phycisphaeraceae bacterium D3-23]